MNKIHDKIGLLICCCVGLYFFDEPSLQIISLCSAITCSCLSQCYPQSKFSLAIEAIYFLLCFINPIFIVFAPLIAYDCFADKRVWMVFIPALFLIRFQDDFKLIQILLFAGEYSIAYVSQYHTARLEYVEHKLIETRDNSEELNLLLLNKNRQLRQSQDSEIYLATLQERNRIAREIHDNVGHMLTRSLLQVGALIIVNKNESQKESLESLKETLNTAMTSIRSSVHNLHDDSINLKQNISDMLKPMEETYKINLDMDFSDNLPKDIKVCFIGIIKEGLSNIIKHSNANKINIIIREHPAFYQLAVEDNGTDAKAIPENGIGLSNMKDRVENLGGLIQFYCNKNGFKIFVSIRKNRRNL